ncbi:hypothetical protein N7449_011801 [Neofusicoccum parvum]|nr:hypothetical protein N7449_011801 [Neofusicoccum parvum]
MFTTTAFGALLGAAAAGYVIYQCLFAPLAKFPGPFWAKLSKVWRAYSTSRDHFHRDLVELHRRYGDVVRIGPNELSVGDPTAFKEIYTESYSVIQGRRPFDLTGERSEKVHSEQRKLVARAYSMDSMVYLEPKINAVVESLTKKLDQLCGQTIDLGDWLQFFAFDVIGSVSFSREFGYVEAGDDQGVFQRIQNSMGSAAWLMHAGWFFRVHQRLQPLIGNWLACNDRNGYFHNVARREVFARMDRGGDNKDILGQLLTVQKEKPQLNNINISFMMTSNVFAGSDTTSIALRSILYLLLTHPAAHDRLMCELQERESKGDLSEPVTFQQAESWPYLQAVMHEALRLYSPAGFILDREVPPGGMMIGGRHIPERVVVGTSAWVIHRLPEIWGPDVDEFKPERWLDGDKEGDLKRHFFAFGGGSRTCIGKNLSWLEIGKLIPTLMMRYKIKLADSTPMKEEYG